MAENFQIRGTVGTQPIDIQASKLPSDWSDPALYAPAVPGILVALLGLWLSHVLTRRRERRREISELCDTLKEKVDEAVEVAVEAWMSEPSESRNALIAASKHKIQLVGIAATNLSRRSMKGTFTLLRYVVSEIPTSINVLASVADLRRVATDDPFEDLRAFTAAAKSGARSIRRRNRR